MFGKIIYISDNIAHINIPAGTPIGMNLINMNVVFEDTNKKILGEVVDVSKELITYTDYNNIKEIPVIITAGGVIYCYIKEVK